MKRNVRASESLNKLLTLPVDELTDIGWQVALLGLVKGWVV